MSKPAFKMTYHCPLKISTLSNTDNGRFCDQCCKNVVDVQQYSSEEIIQKINHSKDNFCGIFDPIQLQNPFGDKRDKIINWYQKISQSGKAHKRILVFAAFLILAITGCRRRTMGYAGYSYHGTPVLRVHPKSIIEFTEAPDFVKHHVYKIHLHYKKEKKKKSRK